MAARRIKSKDEVTAIDIPHGDQKAQPTIAVAIPVPKRKLTFEEAVLATTEQFDEALRSLVK